MKFLVFLPAFIALLFLPAWANTDSAVKTQQPALVLTARFQLAPDEIDDLLALANLVVEKTNREAGCISYGFFASTSTPHTYIFVEEWASEDALKQHLAQDYTKALITKLEQFSTAPAQVRLHQVTDTAMSLAKLNK